MRSVLTIIRPGNLLMVLAAQVILSVFALPGGHFYAAPLFDPGFWTLSLSVVAVAAGGYVINDYYDVKIDAVNRPDTYVVGRTVNRPVAMVLHWTLTSAGVVAGYFVHPLFSIINLSAAFLLWWYSVYLKKLPLAGNVAVSVLTAVAVVVPELYLRTGSPEVPAFAVLAFFANLVREIIKDCEDVKGDKAFGCRTLPIVWGISRTKRVIYITQVLLTVSPVIAVSILTGFAPAYAWFVAAIVVFNVAMAVYIHRADTVKDFHRLSTWAKLMMLLGLLGPVII